MSIKLHIATPCYGCKMRKEFALQLMQLQAVASQHGIHVQIDLLGNESLITRARNILAGKFLKSTGTHLLFIDSDVVFDPKTVLRLLQFDKDIVTAVYPKKTIAWDTVKAKLASGNPEPAKTSGLDLNVNFKPGKETTVDNFVQVLDGATGFMLFKRSALQKMVDHYTDLVCVNDVVHCRDTLPEYTAIFDCMICPDTRRYLSEDFAACRRAQAIGLEIWADLVSGLTHIGSHQLRGDAMQRFDMVYAG